MVFFMLFSLKIYASAYIIYVVKRSETMKKIEWLNRINWIILGIVLGVDILLGFLFGFDIRFYYSSILFLAVAGLINLIFIAIKEFSVLSYDSKRYDPVMNSCFIVIGVAAYYLVEYAGGYDRFCWLYWIAVVLLSILAVVIVYFLNDREKKKQKNKGRGPKVMINHK